MENIARRHTLIHDRYQVVCADCGFLASAQQFSLALRIARDRVARHGVARHSGTVTIHDMMAHRGEYEQWDCEGNPRGRLKI